MTCKHEKLVWLPRKPAVPNAKTWVLGCGGCGKAVGTGRGTIHIDVDDGMDW